ncbi:hypothetical protein AB4Z45_16470 [Paenibacillus sp. MCAF9]
MKFTAKTILAVNFQNGRSYTDKLLNNNPTNTAYLLVPKNQ